MVWFGKDLEEHLFLTPLGWAGTSGVAPWCLSGEIPQVRAAFSQQMLVPNLPDCHNNRISEITPQITLSMG